MQTSLAPVLHFSGKLETHLARELPPHSGRLSTPFLPLRSLPFTLGGTLHSFCPSCTTLATPRTARQPFQAQSLKRDAADQWSREKRPSPAEPTPQLPSTGWRSSAASVREQEAPLPAHWNRKQPQSPANGNSRPSGHMPGSVRVRKEGESNPSPTGSTRPPWLEAEDAIPSEVVNKKSGLGEGGGPPLPWSRNVGGAERPAEGLGSDGWDQGGEASLDPRRRVRPSFAQERQDGAPATGGVRGSAGVWDRPNPREVSRGSGQPTRRPASSGSPLKAGPTELLPYSPLPAPPWLQGSDRRRYSTSAERGLRRGLGVSEPSSQSAGQREDSLGWDEGRDWRKAWNAGEAKDGVVPKSRATRAAGQPASAPLERLRGSEAWDGQAEGRPASAGRTGQQSQRSGWRSIDRARREALGAGEGSGRRAPWQQGADEGLPTPPWERGTAYDPGLPAGTGRSFGVGADGMGFMDRGAEQDEVAHMRFEGRAERGGSGPNSVAENLRRVGIHRRPPRGDDAGQSERLGWGEEEGRGEFGKQGRASPGRDEDRPLFADRSDDQPWSKMSPRPHGMRNGFVPDLEFPGEASQARDARGQEGGDTVQEEPRVSLHATFPWDKLELSPEEEEALNPRKEKPPTLAELTIPSAELKRLRTLAMTVRNRVKVGRAGVTEGIVEYCHNAWRTSEVVKVKCEGPPAYDMKQTAEDLEKLTGGLIIWRSGGAAAIYRGSNYVPPAPNTAAQKTRQGEWQSGKRGFASEAAAAMVDNSPAEHEAGDGELAEGDEEHGGGAEDKGERGGEGDGEGEDEDGHGIGHAQGADEEDVTAGLGPKVEPWTGQGPAPVDADQLLEYGLKVQLPYRMLPYGVKPHLTNSEMTTLRRYAKKLPPHFMLGHNRGLEGLAAAMIQLWDRVEVAKIQVKRNVLNTSNERMAENLKKLTGGTLLARDKFFIVMYRGKDFLPSSIAATLRERHEKALMHADLEERARLLNSPKLLLPSEPPDGPALPEMPGPETEEEKAARAGALEESLALKERWAAWRGEEQTEARHRAALEARKLEEARRIEKKLELAVMRKERAALEVAKLDELLRPAGPPEDRETITAEERYMFKKLGLKMKAYLEMGKRGVFDGVIENMHLHWKHRELVKIICKEKGEERVRGTAQRLEWESGGILVDIIPVKKFHAIIVYRGKNYERPKQIRPRTLLSKRQALKRAVEEQRRVSLEQHMKAMEARILQLRRDLARAEREAGREPGELTRSVDALLERAARGPDPAVLDKFIQERAEKTARKEQEKAEKAASREEALEGPSFRAAPLSLKEQLELRTEALKLGRKVVFQMGRNNVVSGLATAVRLAFLQQPLVKVGIKGRAPGTPVEDIIRLLEEATGGVFVSREPNKIILYRGWPAGQQRPDKERPEEGAAPRAASAGPAGRHLAGGGVAQAVTEARKTGAEAERGGEELGGGQTAVAQEEEDEEEEEEEEGEGEGWDVEFYDSDDDEEDEEEEGTNIEAWIDSWQESDVEEPASLKAQKGDDLQEDRNGGWEKHEVGGGEGWQEDSASDFNGKKRKVASMGQARPLDGTGIREADESKREGRLH